MKPPLVTTYLIYAFLCWWTGNHRLPLVEWCTDPPDPLVICDGVLTGLLVLFLAFGWMFLFGV